VSWTTSPPWERGNESFAAAREAGFEKIFTDIRADNLVSLGFHLSLGFRVVGTAVRHARVGGRYHDVWLVERQL
jgi:L-amino acid N-acyltransferase YncA